MLGVYYIRERLRFTGQSPPEAVVRRRRRWPRLRARRKPR
jgi:hypothetical protein